MKIIKERSENNKRPFRNQSSSFNEPEVPTNNYVQFQQVKRNSVESHVEDTELFFIRGYAPCNI